MMTNLEVLRYAYNGALAIWATENEHYENHKNELNKYRAEKAWQKLEEIRTMLLKEEKQTTR